MFNEEDWLPWLPVCAVFISRLSVANRGLFRWQAKQTDKVSSFSYFSFSPSPMVCSNSSSCYLCLMPFSPEREGVWRTVIVSWNILGHNSMIKEHKVGGSQFAVSFLVWKTINSLFQAWDCFNYGNCGFINVECNVKGLELLSRPKQRITEWFWIWGGQRCEVRKQVTLKSKPEDPILMLIKLKMTMGDCILDMTLF